MSGPGKGQIAGYAVAAVLLVVAGVYLLHGGGGPAPPAGGGVALDGAGGAARGPKPDAGATRQGPLYVHVAGAVRRPGIYRVARGSRVAAAVRRAGGLTRRADLTAFNLASSLRDAQQVIVPRRGEAGARAAEAGLGAQSGTAAAAGGAAGPGAGAGPGRPITLSTATPEQLDTLDGIGPKLAAAIVAYRNQHHGFKTVDELREVDGIGEKRFGALRGAVRP